VEVLLVDQLLQEQTECQQMMKAPNLQAKIED
jgi:hypothetical protein